MCYPTYKMGNVKCRTLYDVLPTINSLSNKPFWHKKSALNDY